MISPDELIIDNFAGGGGASTGIYQALGRHPDIAINHDAAAVAMHTANHPTTLHYCQNIWKAHPDDVVKGRKVGLAWFSPDCKHFSRAKGGKPVQKNIRDLAWVVIAWAKQVRPRVICLENVEEFKTWGPLTSENKPCPVEAGSEFKRWVGELKRLGYKVEWRTLKACDFGAPTIRKRLFLVARCDGLPIRWPEPSHGDPKSIEVQTGLRKPWRTAAEIIDWSLPCPSIFLTQDEALALRRATGINCNRPLADKTMARIARGLKRFVIDAEEPFIVGVGGRMGQSRERGLSESLQTLTAKADSAIAVPFTVPRYGERPGQTPRTGSVQRPLPTIVGTANGSSLVTAFLAKHFGGMTGVDIRTPFPTITTRGTQNQVVASNLVKLRGTCKDGQRTDQPMPTLTASGTHVAEVRAFLAKFYGADGAGQPPTDPLHTAAARSKLGLVMVAGELHQIVDIGMRMLSPRELFRAQGFGDDYKIDPMFNGKPLTKSEQVSKCGNSVPPDVAEALLSVNFQDAVATKPILSPLPLFEAAS